VDPAEKAYPSCQFSQESFRIVRGLEKHQPGYFAIPAKQESLIVNLGWLLDLDALSMP
jgi:hypothetical protein